MSASRYILSIDLGTGGPKVAVVGDDWEIAASTSRPVQTHRIPPGGAEQDPEEIWSAILDAAGQVVRDAAVPPESILGVACASQYFSVVPVDASGCPVSNLVLWMDVRGGAHTRAMYQAHPDAFLRWIEIAGMPPLPTGNDSLSHMLFIKNERPEVYERAHKLVEPMDYVTGRLSGVSTANACSAFAQLLTDNRRLDAVEYHDELLAMSGIDREKLPDLVEVGSPVGSIQKHIARQIGLSPDTPVFSGINDTQAVAIGSGTFQGSHGGISIGTTCQVLAFVEGMRADLENGILAMPSPVPGLYAVMAEIGLAGKTLEHFLDNVVFANDALGDHSSADPFAGVEKILESTTAGSGGLLYLPWLTGAQSPKASPAMRGGFLNLSLETTRAQMLRAVLEGVSFSLRWALPAVERFAGREFDELSFAGGGAGSDAWAQMLADVMDRPVLQLEDARQVNNRAAALVAFERLGIVGFDDVEKLQRIKRSYRPVPESRDIYDKLFPQFLAAFEQNRPIFEALNG